MAGKLSARKVESTSKPGRYSDGDNLYVFISPNGGKRWTFFYRFGKTADGKPVRREMEFGSAAKARGFRDGQNRRNCGDISNPCCRPARSSRAAIVAHCSAMTFPPSWRNCGPRPLQLHWQWNSAS
jgi:hypothetical protein